MTGRAALIVLCGAALAALGAGQALGAQEDLTLSGWMDALSIPEETEAEPPVVSEEGELSAVRLYASMPGTLGLSDTVLTGASLGLRRGFRTRSPRVAGAILLTILVPGTGHFLYGSTTAYVFGFVHLGIDLVCGGLIAALINSASECQRAMNVVVSSILVMLIHRIECIIEVMVWGKVQETRGLVARDGRPRFSVYYEPGEGGDEFGASLSMGF
jgi:hypothetical protein